MIPYFLEERVDAQAWIQWTADHMELPVAAIGFYLLFIFHGQKLLAKPMDLKLAFSVWNFGLSIYSMYGASRMVPYMWNVVSTKGFRYSICENGWQNNEHPEMVYWLMLFIYSKYAELIDTVFLVLRKKNVIFLHWFHHVTVLLYCQHAWAMMISAGPWFATMNYCVHSIMYMYYFLAKIGYYKLLQPIAPLITVVQILQMVGGMYILLNVANEQLAAVQMPGESWKDASLRTCRVDPANWKMGLLMYFSYFVLFVLLFFDKYCAKKSRSKGKDCLPCEPTGFVTNVENVNSTGFFHDDSRPKKESKKKQ